MKIASLFFFVALRSTGLVHATFGSTQESTLGPNNTAPFHAKKTTFLGVGRSFTSTAALALRRLDDIEKVCIDEEDAFVQCINEQPEVCGGNVERNLRTYPHHRQLEHTTCDSFQFEICSGLATFTECPCSVDYIALQDCSARNEFKLECDPFSTEVCTEVPCVEDVAAIYQCFMSNPEVCPQDNEGDERRKLTGGDNERRLEDIQGEDFTCKDYELEYCYFSVLFPECPCSTEYKAGRICEAKQDDLECETPSTDTCESLCFTEEVTFTQCYFENFSTCSNLGNVGDARQRKLRILDQEGPVLETCEEYQVEACGLPLFFLDCPCQEDYKAFLTCSAEQGGLVCDEFTLNDCDICPYCGDAVECFDNNGFCYFDPINAKWSGTLYEGCNYGASDCAECYPDASCDPDDICTQCASALECYDQTGFCFLDLTLMVWGEPYEACNAGADICAECFPDSTCKCGSVNTGFEQCIGLHEAACVGENENRFLRRLGDAVPTTCMQLQEEYCSNIQLRPECPCAVDYFSHLACTYEEMGCVDFTDECGSSGNSNTPEPSPLPTNKPTRISAPVPTPAESGSNSKNLILSSTALAVIGAVIFL